MRTVTFQSVLYGVATRLGLEPSHNLQTNQALALSEYINDRLETAWELEKWPEWTLAEERQFRADYNAGTAYVIGNEVYYPTGNAYYRAIAPGTGNLPTNTNFWEPATDLNAYVARAQSWEDNELGEVWGVYLADPRTTDRPRRVGFWESPDGIQMDTSATTVWIEFGLPHPRFTAVTWDAASAYVVGDLVYLAATGECYEAIQAGTGQDPSTQAAYWLKQDFPYVLAKHVKLAAIADALREDEEFDKAIAAEAKAQEALFDAIEKAERMIRQPGGYVVAFAT